MDLNDLSLSVEGEAIAAMNAGVHSSDKYKYAKIPSMF
jgi:hypothetical protein